MKNEDTVVTLQTVSSPVLPIDQDLIDGLEALLDMARNGNIQGLVYATIKSRGLGQYDHCGTGWRGAGVDNNVHTVIGGLSILQARLIHEKDTY